MRSLLLLVIATVISHFSFAQAQLGVKAGINLNNLHVADNKGTGFHVTGFHVRPGLTFGFTVGLKASEHFTVQPELDYSSLEAKDGFTNSTFRYAYINLPVLLKYQFSSSGVHAYVGPQLGFLTKASIKTAGVKTDVKDNLTNTNFSGVIGLDVNLKNGLKFDLRYQNDFLNVVKTEDADPYKSRSQVISFTVGYIFKCVAKKGS